MAARSVWLQLPLARPPSGEHFGRMAPCGLQWGCLFRRQHGGWKDL